MDNVDRCVLAMFEVLKGQRFANWYDGPFKDWLVPVTPRTRDQRTARAIELRGQLEQMIRSGMGIVDILASQSDGPNR